MEHVEVLNRKIKDIEPKKIESWSEEKIALLLGDLMILKNKDSFSEKPKEYRQKSFETYSHLKELFKDYGADFHEDVSEIYKEYSSTKPIIIRREDPLRVVQLVNGNNIEIDFDPKVIDEKGDKYANCALWPYGPMNTTSGIANSFLEGRSAAGPIVTVMGFKNNPNHMKIEEPEDKMLNVGTVTRHGVKILSGEIKLDDLEFIIIRMPITFFDKKELSPSELKAVEEKRLTQIFRGFKF